MNSEQKHSTDHNKVYKKPQLTRYGNIVQLTQTANGDCRDNENAFNNAEPGAGFTCS